jgi:carotenoid cleavage dioxygenase
LAKPFPENPFLAGNYAPLRAEVEAPDLVVEGELPEGLDGTLYRNGPNPLFAPRGRYHYFTGDGMVHAFTVRDGRVSYRNRWVQTAKWRADAEAGEALFGAFGNPLESDERAQGIPSNVANTHIVSHAGRLLALEEQSPPFELEAETLRSLGPYTFDGALPGHMTAHPKLDPETGELHFFAYGVGGFGATGLGYYVADAAGEIIRSEHFDAPYGAMVHDFAITEHYVIFPIFPATIDVKRAMSGGPFIGFDRELPNHLGVLRRDRPVEEIRWLSGDPSYVFHPMNAYEESDGVVLDVMNYGGAPGFPGVDGSRPRREDAIAYLERWTVESCEKSDDWRVERLDDQPGEFPRIDDRVNGRPYRHGWAASSVHGTAARTIYDTIVHYDLAEGRRHAYSLPEGDCASEPVFVPRGDDAAEGDGWVLSVLYRGATRTSELAVFEALAVEQGPVARALLDTRVPNGFHGSWVPSAE